MRWLPVVLVLGLYLSGCTMPSDRAGPTVETVTPADVPSLNADDFGPDVPAPPGIDGFDVVDPDRLSAAHQRALVNRSYTWRKTVTIQPIGSDVIRQREVVTAAVRNRSAYRFDRTIYGSNTTDQFSVYSADGVQYVRQNRSGSVRYWTLPADGTGPGVVGDAGTTFATVLDGTETVVTEISTDDGPRFVVQTAPSVENTTIRAVVRPNGLIEYLSVTLIVGDGDDRRLVSYRGSIVVGSPTLERPSWIRNVTATVD